MTMLNQSERQVALKKKLRVTSMAAALGLTGAPIALAQSATLEEIIVTSRQRRYNNLFKRCALGQSNWSSC